MKFEFSTFKTVASCSILMLTNLSLSGQEKLIIDDEVVSKVKINENDIKVIASKEIDDYTFIKGKVLTYYYDLFLDSKKAAKESYDEYMNNPNKSSSYIPPVVKEYPEMLEKEKTFSEEYKYKDGLVKSANKSKRIAYFEDAQKSISNFSTMKGDYEVISKYMTIARETIDGKFVENEVSDKIFKEYGQDGEGSILIKNSENNSYYLLSHDIYERIGTSNFANEGIVIAKKFGYTIYDDKGYKYIKTKYYDISCSGSLNGILQKDKDYLKKIDVWYEQRQSIRKQLIPLLPKLKHYIQLYNVQRNRMSKSDILAWSSLTKSAIALNDKEVDYLVNKLFGFSDRCGIEEKQNKVISEISEYIAASRGVLGL
ncbi:hypothetical protein [Chryseobacterium aquaticum]|uniref:hypothetical protein n=1 Tax=Chryseobacterium aquaticum TaxID=452084 RepID=UPI002FC62F37